MPRPAATVPDLVGVLDLAPRAPPPHVLEPQVARRRAQEPDAPEILLLNLSGRGDKDIDHVRRIFAAQAEAEKATEDRS